MNQQKLLDQLERCLQTAQANLLAATGDSSVCQIHKENRTTVGLKYAVGQAVSLRSLIKSLDGLPPDELDADHIENVCDQEHQKWKKMFDRHSSNSIPSQDWVSYAQGGMDELEAVMALIGG